MGKKKAKNGNGHVRKLNNGKWECQMISSLINPKTMKPKRMKRTADTEQEAREKCKKALQVWETEIRQGKEPTKYKKTTSFGEYMTIFINEYMSGDNGLSDSSYHTYVSVLNNSFHNDIIALYQLHNLDIVAFQEYYDRLLEKKSRKTATTPRQLCIRCCDWLIDKGLLKENYAKKARFKTEKIDEYNHKRDSELKNQKKVFSNDDIKKFYNAYKDNVDSEYPCVVLFLLETGLRIGEFASLRNDNVHLDEGYADIVETRSIRYKDNNDHSKGVEEYSKVPKNKESRRIPLTNLAKELVEYMQKQTKEKCVSNPDNLLYPSFRSGKRRSNSSMEVCFKKLCDKLEIDRDVRMTKTGQLKGLSLHSLRHTFETIANTSPNSNKMNTALMSGHKDTKSEDIYTHATLDAMRRIPNISEVVLGLDKEKNEHKKDSLNISELSEEEAKEILAQLFAKIIT